MSEHRVEGHLGVSPEAYDAEIRRFIPGYEEMIATAVRWLAGHVREGGTITELGGGTGALTHAILSALPSVTVRVVDIDPNMLAVAAKRCASFADRVVLEHARFDRGLAKSDAVVASLALHHVFDLDEKRALYRAIHAALVPGGLLVVADATAHADGPERTRLFDEWAAGMMRHGITEAEAHAHFEAWAEEDRYYPLVTELDSLARAGFRHPDCFWKHGAIAVYGGFRDLPL